MPCWKCGGWLYLEPARVTCKNCGVEALRRRIPERGLRLQLAIDFQLKSVCPGSTDAVTLGEYLECVGYEGVAA